MVFIKNYLIYNKSYYVFMIRTLRLEKMAGRIVNICKISLLSVNYLFKIYLFLLILQTYCWNYAQNVKF